MQLAQKVPAGWQALARRCWLLPSAKRVDRRGSHERPAALLRRASPGLPDWARVLAGGGLHRASMRGWPAPAARERRREQPGDTRRRRAAGWCVQAGSYVMRSVALALGHKEVGIQVHGLLDDSVRFSSTQEILCTAPVCGGGHGRYKGMELVAGSDVMEGAMVVMKGCSGRQAGAPAALGGSGAAAARQLQTAQLAAAVQKAGACQSAHQPQPPCFRCSCSP